jgi:ribokinase
MEDENMISGRKPGIVVIGPIFVDMAIRCGHIPLPGQSVIGNTLSYIATGPGPNQAVEAALCGCDVYLLSKIGGDPFGQMAKESLSEYKVNVEYVHKAEAKNTGVVVTLVSSAGENASCYYTGANMALVPKDVEEAENIISETNVCLIHGGFPQEAIVAAIKCAKIHGKKVILNPEKPLDQKVQESGGLPTEYFLADIIISNLGEAADITDHSTSGVRTAKLIGSEMVARGIKYAVITMGKRGAMVVSREGAEQIPIFEVESVDNTGRGDAFTGALGAYYAVEDDVRGAVKFASAAGALACTKYGSIESMPTKADIIQLLQKEDMG